MADISHNLGAQASMLLFQSNNNNNNNSTGSGATTGNNIYSVFISLLFSSFLVSIISQFSNKFYLPDIFNFSFIDFLENYGYRKKKYTITLSSRRFFNKFGRHSNDITNEKLSILYKIQKSMNNCKDLYKLEQDYIASYDYDDDDYCRSSYYNMNQTKPIEIYKKGEYSIKVQSIDNSLKENEEGKTKTSDIKMTKINELILTSYNSLEFIKEFIEKCVKERNDDLKSEKKRYIFTYLGEDDQKKLSYDKDLFIPYANFGGLVGTNSSEIEKDFDFFQSDEGIKWYKNRNVPYQITHLYHGIPGTGKSIVASAIAHKYNLHIVRIKLSLIKTSREFIKVFKNTKINNIQLDFKNILYLFDEMDTELEKLLNNGTNNIDKVEKYLKKLKKKNKKTKNISPDVSDSESSDSEYQDIIVNQCNINNLTIGTILEEMSGINQMYGRKMIIITNNFNKLKKIHNGALIRPGRVDRIMEFKKCTPSESKTLINNFYPNMKFTDSQIKLLGNHEWTAAKISSICKISKNIDECLNTLVNDNNNI